MAIFNLVITFFTGPVFAADKYATSDKCSNLTTLIPDRDFSKSEQVTKHSLVRVSVEEVHSETGARRELAITEIHTKNPKQVDAKELFGEDSDLIIGIDVQGNTQGHCYLVIGNTRIDGRMFFAPNSKVQDLWKLGPGLVLRYKNIPPANKEALLSWVKSQEHFKSPTCVATACKILYNTGGFQDGPNKPYWFPSRLLSHLAKNGLVGTNGEVISPEIYSLNRDVRMVWENLPDWKAVPSFIFKVLFDPYTWKGVTDKSFKQ